MPSALTYPGVYVEEISSGVRTITGVATSVTAFIGRARMGPVNEATTINSFGDFERTFGGLWAASTLGYAVRDFYLNGGAQAVIVRIAGDNTSASTLTASGINLVAANPGAWGKNLQVIIDTDVTDAKAASMGLTKADLFNLTVKNTAPGGGTERFANVTTKAGHPRNITKVLEAQSDLVRTTGSLPGGPIAAGTVDLTSAITTAEAAVAAAALDVTTKQANLATAQAIVPPDAAAVTTATNALTTSQTALSTAKTKLDALGSDGDPLKLANFFPANAEADKLGLYALEQADIFNLLCIPPYTAVENGNVDTDLVGKAAAYCEKRRAMLLVDPPSDWTKKATAVTKFKDTATDNVGTRSKNAALFFPRLSQPNPLADNQVQDFAPCGAVAGIFARTDTTRGVWKAPAGLEAKLIGVPQLSVPLTDAENGELNPLGVNCLRAMPAAGRVVWGSRTLEGDDRLGSEWKYIPVRRTALYIEESLYRGTQWVVFEPNDEPLWSQIRLNIGAFMNNLFRQGAFQGKTSREAYFVKCDKETTTQNDINLGIVNIHVGFAPLKPAEFVVLKIQQIAGNIDV